MSHAKQRIVMICSLITSIVIVVSGCSAHESMKGSSTTASITSSLNDWPSDVPLYPGSVQHFVKEKNTVVLASADTIEAVKNYYKSELPLQGWTMTSSMVLESNSIFRAEKGNRVIFMTVTGEDASVNIALSVSKKP